MHIIVIFKPLLVLLLQDFIVVFYDKFCLHLY